MTNKVNDAIDHPYDWIDPQAEYWATHGKPEPGKWYPMAGVPGGFITYETSRLDTSAWELKNNPWVNGRLALAALVWGLIFLVVFGVGAGP